MMWKVIYAINFWNTDAYNKLVWIITSFLSLFLYILDKNQDFSREKIKMLLKSYIQYAV